ncbi:hypothetical protein BDP27DRAFT_1314520 [Rhodocollybia butyracea]|uniref:DUF1682-domain-containing protein n=1 Tax=Rhodocollybia butyracea TaxID=206335 RepID=A0A9P5Q6Q3_9AGAR|nr:hypothetical protein BDP27DRAFT_1314520 [Rhodocollybia butyracea]
MASFVNILGRITPPPFNAPAQYDGVEYRWKFLVFRPAYFQTEAILLGALLFYVAFFFVGQSINAKKAEKWANVYRDLLKTQFSSPHVKGLVRDGHSDFFIFSTGRRSVASLHTIFKLRPYHDFLQTIYQTVWSMVDLQYSPRNDLQLDFTLFPSALSHDFVWAVVDKDELKDIRDNRWDLTFTKTSDNTLLPPNLSVMSEFADVTESIFKNTAILDVLKDPKIAPYFRSLSVTDQPRQRPTSVSTPEKHVILNLICPSPSHASDPSALVAALFPFVDALSKVSLRPETKIKLKKTREAFEKTLKVEAEQEKKEELEQAREDQKAAKRKAEDERISKLSSAEQQKILERERKRSIRKSQGKAVRK